jgi:hypothetical protein
MWHGSRCFCLRMLACRFFCQSAFVSVSLILHSVFVIVLNTFEDVYFSILTVNDGDYWRMWEGWKPLCQPADIIPWQIAYFKLWQGLSKCLKNERSQFVLRETSVWWVGGVVYDSAIGSRGQRWPCFQVFSGDSSFKLQCLCVSSFILLPFF